jgi:hypothetical protein
MQSADWPSFDGGVACPARVLARHTTAINQEDFGSSGSSPAVRLQIRK